MTIKNNDISSIFYKVADFLEIKNENPFRIKAYRNAAQHIENSSVGFPDMVKENKDLTEISSIGKDLAEKIKEIVLTGKLKFLEDLKKEIPIELDELMKIQGLGAKRIKILYEKLNIRDVEDLRAAILNEQIRNIDGFGEKIEQNISKGLDLLYISKKQTTVFDADEISNDLLEYLKKNKTSGIKELITAGSLRRRKETVRDLDILAICKNHKELIDHFVKYDNVTNVLSKGDTKASIQLKSGLQIDLRVVPDESYGAALHYFTGSKEHNVAIRKIAIKKNLKVNEYGVYKGEKQIAGKTEKSIYDTFEMSYIEPEMRENRGEIELALKNKLPKLIDIKNIKSDLHMHSNYSDGSNTIKEMAQACEKIGYKYIAITDHSKRVTIAHGLDEKRLLKQIEEIDKLNDELKNITILKSMEVDILEDGSLDLPNNILEKLDFTICSIHSKFNLSREKQTERVLKAMDNPNFNIFGHPSGRLINQRNPYEIDIEKIIKYAKEQNCFMELNAHYSRLDLNDINCKFAKDLGVKISIGSDSHSVDGLMMMKYGIGQARRGWLEPEDVLNTLDLKEFKKLIKRK
jgi:DNA polymerase (family X)